MNILFILEHFYPHIGGAETIFKGYASYLVKNGCNVTVATSNSGGIDGVQTIEGITVHYFPWKSFFGHPLPSFRDIEPLAKSCDVIHTATYTAAPFARIVAKKYHKPCVITVYEALGKKWFWIEQNRIKAMLFYMFEHWVVSQQYDMYHAISDATQKDLLLKKIPPQNIVTIYPGVSFHKNSHTDEKPMIPADKRYFLYFGRPGKTKGIFVLLEAIKKAHAHLPSDVHFLCVMSNDPYTEKKMFIDEIQHFQLHQRVTIIDSLPTEQLNAVIQHAFCVIIPSITEGFGFSAVESCVLGKPVIVSDAGSLPEVVFGKVLQFQNRNSEDLAKNIMLALENKFSLVTSKTFDWNESTQKLIELYNKVHSQK